MQILLIGPTNSRINEAAKIAHSRGAKVTQLNSIDNAVEAIRNGVGSDLIICEVSLDIKKLISQLDKERISADVVACGIGSDAKSAVDAIKSGAKEYIPLPPDPELIAAILEAATNESHNLLYNDASMARTVKLAEKIASSDANILITGESGTGKEILSRFVHRKSKRADKRFVSLNCAAIPENLLESELFGHEKGAFTGAVARRIGKFEQADGGTLLLDEISEMDVRLQAKLLRAIQEKEIERVGSNQPVKINLRVIATSNRNLKEEIKKGTFREDLYFRLNVINLQIPSLKERPGDIDVLSNYFVKTYSKLNDLDEKSISTQTLNVLKSYNWPGNVRELENTMHRAVLLSSTDKIEPDDIHLPQDNSPSSLESVTTTHSQTHSEALVGRTVADVEKELILNTLDQCLGNRTHAANILGISIRTLRNKLKLYQDENPFLKEKSAS